MQVRTLGIVVGVLMLGGLVTVLLRIDGSGPTVRTAVNATVPPGQVEAAVGTGDAALVLVERVPAPPSNVVLDTEKLGGATRAMVPLTSEPEVLAARADLRIEGRFVDVHGSPLAGVELYCVEPEGRVSSAQDGRFELQLSSPIARLEKPLDLVATLTGFVRLELDPLPDHVAGDVRVTLGDVVLSAAGGVSGQVVDETGAGVAQARVIVTAMGPLGWSARGSGPDTPMVEGVSESDGRFRLNGVGAGEVRVWGGLEGAWWAYSDSVQVESGRESADILLRLEQLEPEDVIELRVVDPDGQPVPKARLVYYFNQDGSSASGSAETDEDGAYRRVLERRAAFDFVARDPEGRYRPAVARGVLPGTVDLVLVLGIPRPLVVRVRDTAGKTVPAFHVSCRSGTGGRWLGGASQSSTEEGGDTVVFQLPEEMFELTAEAQGYRSTKLGPLEPHEVGDAIEIALPPLPGVRGRVFDRAGKPVVGATVGLHEAASEEYRLTVNGFPARSQRYASTSGVTDDEGRFTLTLQETGNFYLRAQRGSGAGSVVGELGPLELDGSVGARGLRVDLPQGGEIEGRLLLAPGRDVAGLVVGISRGDGFAVTGRTGARGRFRFSGLTPGDWLVKRCSEDIRAGWTSTSTSASGAPWELPWSCEVWPGRTTHFDLDLTQAAQVVLVGRLALSGAPATGWTAGLRRADSPDTITAEDLLDSQGDFRLELAAAGDHILTFRGAGPSRHVFMRQEIQLEAGTSDWSRDLPLGIIEGRVSLEFLREGEQLGSSWTGADGLSYRSFISPGEDGSFSLHMPAGQVELRYQENDPIQVDVREGGLTRVDIP